jgi:hypothetical protein
MSDGRETSVDSDCEDYRLTLVDPHSNLIKPTLSTAMPILIQRLMQVNRHLIRENDIH